MNQNRHVVRTLESDEVADIVDVLCESFFDYPVMRFVIGDVQDYGRQLTKLIHFFVMARVLRDETMLGVGASGSLSAAALVSYPSSTSAPRLDRIRGDLWADLGADARSRYEAFGEATAPFDVDQPNIHLNMIGVRRDAKGSGCGRVLIDYVHHMSQADPDSAGVTLTTEDENNIALYEHFGYRVVGHDVVAPGLETWGFFRPD